MDDETLAIGVGSKTTIEGIKEAEDILRKKGIEIRVVPVQLPEKYAHLGLLFVVIAECMRVACLEALPSSFVETLKDRKFSIIEVNEEEAMLLKNNLLSIDGKNIISFKDNKDVNTKLEASGFEVYKPQLSIFTKGGGGLGVLLFQLIEINDHVHRTWYEKGGG